MFNGLSVIQKKPFIKYNNRKTLFISSYIASIHRQSNIERRDIKFI